MRGLRSSSASAVGFTVRTRNRSSGDAGDGVGSGNERVPWRHFRDGTLDRAVMQKLAEVCIARPVFAVMLIMALVVVGSVSYTKLGIDRFPNVDLPIITVRTILPGAAPEEMESTVTRRIEDAVATVEGIDFIRSTSTESTSITTITFNLK